MGCRRPSPNIADAGPPPHRPSDWAMQVATISQARLRASTSLFCGNLACPSQAERAVRANYAQPAHDGKAGGRLGRQMTDEQTPRGCLLRYRHIMCGAAVIKRLRASRSNSPIGRRPRYVQTPHNGAAKLRFEITEHNPPNFEVDGPCAFECRAASWARSIQWAQT